LIPPLKGISFSGFLTKISNLFGKKVLSIVSNDTANATIVIAKTAPNYIRAAAIDLQEHINLSSGITLPIVTDDKTSRIPNHHVKLAIGESLLTEDYISKKDLQFEEFAIRTILSSQTIMMIANDGPENPATHWAVCEFLERVIGAKWLWPGDLGTFVINKTNITSPPINYQWKSPYDFRLFKKIVPSDVKKWMIHHRIACSRNFQENSNTEDWHKIYYQQYPEIFARTPDGKPYNSKWAVRYPKFRLDHPKYMDLMVEDYIKKGKPALYSLHPTDGGLFDAKMLPDEDPKKVYYGEVPVTKAFLDFYAKFDKKINGEKAVTRFDILAYSAYYYFPDNYTFDGRNFNLWFVDRNNDLENWKKWQETGAKMYLRPNWWNRSSFGPDISYQKRGEMLNFCRTRGLAGIYMGGFKENWSLQGINYYVLARQLYTSKAIDELANEYMEAFGNGSTEVLQYFRLCMANTDRFNNDLLETIKEELDYEDDINFTSVDALPSMFPEKLRSDLRTLLDNAILKSSGTEKIRIEWLRSGLIFTDLVCNYVNAALKSPDKLPDPDILSSKVKEIELKYPFSISSRSFSTVMKKKFELDDKKNTKD
jgi:hypothetical protein